MTDITKVFRAVIKAKHVTKDFNLGLNKHVKKSEKISTNFLSRAKLILNDIIKLKNILLNSRTIYLSPYYLLSSTNKIMNDEQRQEFECNMEKQIKQCRDNLEQLKSSIGQICFQGQRRTHFELVCAYLERDLVECTKIYSEQKCLRYKCESERKKIGRLDTDDQRVILNLHKNNNRKKTNDFIDDTKKSTNTIDNNSNNTTATTTNHHFDQDNHIENDEENQIPSTPPTSSELRQLQIENNQLYHDVAQRSEEIHAISTQVVEIAQLQNELFDNIFMQKDLIEEVDAAAVASNDDLAAAIIHIRDAVRNTAQMRRWIIFFLLVMIFSLLFLDWYNMSDTSTSNSDVEDDIDDILPISSHVNIIHGLKTVSCLTLDSNGMRMITGGHDETMKMFDFTSMDKNFQPFRTIQPCPGRLLRAIEYSANNDMILIIPGDCQAIVVNREASGKHIIYKTVLGDMYVTDMNRTKGHKSLLNYGCWNPSSNSEEFMTCADDCTLRIWSLNKRDQQLHVIRTKGESGRDVRTTTCTYNQSLYHNENLNLIAAGCDNGSILVWDRRRSFVHVTFKCLNAHLQDESITSLKWSYDNQILASRSTDHTLKLWDIRKFNQCLSSYENIYNHFSMTNISFSPNDKFLITGVSKLINSTNDDNTNGKLIIFNRNNLSKIANEILFNDSVIRTLWHPKLNQIFTTTNNGLIRTFYDEQRSPMAGIRLCLNRKEKKSKDTNDFITNINPIITSSSTSDSINEQKKTQIFPEKRKEENKSSSSLHQHFIQTIVKSNFIEKEDSRVELLKYAKEAECNPKWITPAYVHTQPKPIFQQQIEEENDDDDDDLLPIKINILGFEFITMHISVANYGDTEELLTIEIAPDLTIKDLKVVVESESNFGIKADEMNLYFDGKLIRNENQTLEQSNLKDYDVVTCQRRLPSATANPGAGSRIRLLFDPHNPQQLFNDLRANPTVLQRVRQTDPQLADAVERNDMNAFLQYVMNRMAPQLMRPPTEFDLLDPRMQRRIEEAINMENVLDNMEHAYEHAPEFFGHVLMLYINCKINGHPVKAFVDSGAQMTIMSKQCAERCGIMRLIDTRFSGIARGVGTQKILGRIHLAQLEVEKQFFATSLAVLEDQSIDMLLGLDMLRRHRCVIDLDRNVLRIENSVETSFLPESELPAHARLSVHSPGAEGHDLPGAFLQSTAESVDNRRQQRSNQPAAATASASSLTPSPFPEKDIKELTKKGFTREEAIEELKLTNGDVTRALVTLMAKSLGGPKRKN
ncbi:unnamed protein product [Rotaria sordida]|uniref:DNA damage-inducible protein 1 n=1 Tax=Rotaria sordida TaxID=392033 RepID=A0A813Z969_9BILA|nr:unnamed protein product [Rotaria sordida]